MILCGIDRETDMRRYIAPIVTITGLTLLSAPAAAQDLSDRYWLEGSVYSPKVNTTVAVSSKSPVTIGTEIDLESDLDLANDKVLPAIFAGARVGGGFSIAAEYYALRRSGSATIARDITFDDVTYPASATLSSGFDTDIYRLTVGYAFVHNDKFELGAALGAHVTNIEASISGQGSVGNASATTEARSQKVLAPLPTIGIFGTAELLPRLNLNARVDYLSLKIDDYKGRLINAQASLGYRVLKNIGIGIAWRYVDYRLDIDKERVFGRFSYRFSGPAAFLRVGF